MTRYRTHRKNQSHSFGVLEIILSVGILAAFSVSVLQLFVSASGRQKKMQLLDHASFDAVSIVETFKSFSAPGEICGKYGLNKTSGGYSGRYVPGGGLTAEIQVNRQSKNAAGALYRIRVTMRGKDGKTVYRLEDARFFHGVS